MRLRAALPILSAFASLSHAQETVTKTPHAPPELVEIDLVEKESVHVVPELPASRDDYIADLLQNRLHEHTRTLRELQKKGDDKPGEEQLAFSENSDLFEYWLFYRGPKRVPISDPDLLEIVRKHVQGILPLLQTYPTWKDPLRAAEFLEHMPLGASLADNQLQRRIRCLDFSTIKSKHDYETLVDAFHKWLLGSPER